MDFATTEEQGELQGLARQILGDRMTLAHLKARDFSEDWYDRDTWSEFAKANLLGVALPESAGGIGFGFVDLCFVLQEIGRHVAPLPAIPTLVAGALPIARFGTDEQQAVLAKVVSGDLLLTAALIELGAEPDQPVTTATRDASGDNAGWKIDGVKSNVPAAHMAETILVPATTGDDVVMFLVPAGAAGVTAGSVARRSRSSWKATKGQTVAPSCESTARSLIAADDTGGEPTRLARLGAAGPAGPAVRPHRCGRPSAVSPRSGSPRRQRCR